MTFTDEQKKHLNAKLDPKHVASRSKGGANLSYVEGWHVIAEANRIFGFDGWTRELVSLVENTQPTQNAKDNWVVSFRATVRITAGGVTREGTGFGSGIAKEIHDAYEGAIKEAETDAMKRGLMTFGNPFGLALYDKEQTNVGVDPTPAEIWEGKKKFIQKQLNAMTSAAEVLQWTKDNLEKMKTLEDSQLNWVNDQINQAQDRLAPKKANGVNGHANYAGV